MTPIRITVGPLAAASANNIALSQSVVGATTVILNGSTAGVLDKPRRVIVTSAGNDSGITFTIVGTTTALSAVTEVLTGANAGVATSATDFQTVTSITTSGSTAAAITVGTNGASGGPWVRLDSWASNYTGIQCVVAGTANYTVQLTYDDPNAPPPSNVAIPLVTWINSPDAAAVAASTSIDTSFTFTPVFARVVLNSGTGSVVSTFSQYGVAPY